MGAVESVFRVQLLPSVLEPETEMAGACSSCRFWGQLVPGLPEI